MKNTGLIILSFLLLASIVRGQTQLNVTIPNFGTPACATYGYTFNFTTTGDSRANDGTFRVTVVKSSFVDGGTITSKDIVDTGDLCGAYVSGSGTSFTRSGVYYFEPNVVAGDYRLYVLSDRVVTHSNSSNTITVKALPTVVVSGGGTLTYSQSTPITLKFTTGDAPYSFEYKDPFDNKWIAASTSSSTYTIPIRFVESGNYNASDLVRNLKNTCGNGSVSGSVSATVNPIIVTTNSLSNNNICPGRDAPSVSFGSTTGTTVPANNSYSVQLSNSNGSFGSPIIIGTGTTSPITVNAATMKSLSPGQYQVRVVSSNYTQFVQPANSSVALTLTRTVLPTVTPLTYCQGGAPSSLLNSVGGSNIFWYNYTVNGGGDIPYNKSTPPNPPSDPGTYRYQISQTQNSCESALQYLTVMVTGKSNPPGDATIEYCKGAQASPLTTSASNPLWYTGSTQLPGAPTPPTDNATTLTYKVAQGGSCPSDQSTITVKIKDIPSAPTFTPPAPLCQNGPSQVLSASGMGSLQWYDGNNSPLPSAPTPALGNTNAQTYYVTQTVNNCTSAKATIQQIFKPAPGPPTATSPDPVCKDAASVRPSASGSGTIKWYDNNNGSLPDAPLQGTTVPGTFTYRVSQFVDGCESSRVDIKVVVNDKSAVPQATPQTICQNASVAGVSLANGTNLQWFKADGTIIGSTLTLVSTGDGAQTYKVSQETNGCRSDQVTTTLTVTRLPDPPGVTAPGPLCQYTKDADVPVLIATASSGGTLNWFDPTGNKLPGAPKPNTQTAGSITYSVSQNVNNCESATKTPIIQIIKPASDKPTIVTPVMYCRAQTATALTAGGENLKWYDANDNPTTDITPKTNNVGSTIYLVRQTIAANGCASAPASLTVLVQDAPGAPGVSSVPACLGKDLPIADLVKGVTGNNAYTWYLVQTGGTGSAVAPTISTSATGNQSVYVTQKTGICEGPRAELKIVVNPIPAAPTVANLNYCQIQTDQPAQTVSPLTAGGMALRWYNPDGSPAAGIPTPTIDKTGIQSYSVTQTVNTCESPKATLQVSINTTAAPTVAKPTLLYCVNDVVVALTATAETGGKLRWIDPAGKVTDAAPTPPTTNISAKADGDPFYVYQIGANGCYSPRSTILVKVANKPGRPTVANLTPFACLNTTPTALTAGADAGNELIWSGTGITSGTTTAAPTPVATAVTTTPFTYSVVQRLGTCLSDPTVITYSIKPLPTAPSLVSPQVACVGQPPLVLAAAGVTGNTLKWYKETDATPSPSTIPTSQPLTQTWYVTQTDGNGCQSVKSSPLEVKIRYQATATVSGDNRIIAYDSTAIRIQLGGDGPWSMTLWDGTTVTKTLKNPYIKWERPLATRTYSITTISNDCGVGVASNTYTLIVDKALGVESLAPATLSLVVSPNPTTGVLRIEWSAVSRQAVRLRFLSAGGAVLWQADRVGTGAVQSETLQIGDRPAGLYFLQLQSDSAGLLVRKLMKQ